MKKLLVTATPGRPGPAGAAEGHTMPGEVGRNAATLLPAMLYLLSSPAWAAPDQPPRPLPLTLPAALLVVLATQAGWMTREQLALIFWPDAAPGDALHHLRINLHRARGLLDSWGLGGALQAERSRVQLGLPSDLAQLRAAQERGDTTLLSRLSPSQWLHGWRLPGYDGFAQWCDETAQQLQAEWLAASRRGKAVSPDAAPAAPPGRDRELQGLLDSAAPALLLLGEPGAGKTTLLRAAWPQAPCLRGLEGLHGMPYRPLLDTLREHLGVLQRALREPGHALRPYRLDLARVLPELAPDEALPPLDAMTARSRLVEALARAFEALSPLLLIDDLQWLDEASVEWLLMLAHAGRVRWRAAARRHEMPEPLLQALRTLQNADRLEVLELPPLDREGLAQLCSQRQPQQTFSAAQLSQLQALSGGNALLAVELLATGLGPDEEAAPAPLHDSVARLVLDRVQRLQPVVRHAVEAAAVFVQPVPADALRQLAGLPAPASAADDGAWVAACEQAIAAGLLRTEGALLACRHDLIRQAITQALAPARRLVLHRHAALWLATQPAVDALTVAAHWRAAGEAQTALAWCHQGAEQLKSRGRFDEARALWHEVADESLDAAQGLRARLELAACDLFEDLARGEAALNAVRAQLAAVADAEQHRQIEGRALAALVDNRVFAGDIAGARGHAARLRVLLPELALQDRLYAIEVLIELAMREPDIPAAWALLAQSRALAPRRPTLLSFEGQIHWFGGQVHAACEALTRLLERHPDYCRGITIENDLAVMLQALGRIDEAEAMARRSLQSWAGVAHTETLSLLVLGLTLTSAGRFDEADAALIRALQLACEQASPGFEGEARVRRARLLLQRGDALAAQQELDLAAPLLQASPEPLRVSQLALAQVQAAAALGQPLPQAALQRLHEATTRSEHPLVHTRWARAQGVEAFVRGDLPAALAAAERQAAQARSAGLQEVLAEALWVQARAHQLAGAAVSALQPLADAATETAARTGCRGLLQRITLWWTEAQHAAPYQQAVEHWQQGRPAEAEALLQTLLQAAPEHVSALQLLGATLAGQGRVAEALPALQRAVALQPGDAGAHHNLGGALSLLGQLQEARSSLLRSLQLQPDNADALVALAGLHARLNQPHTALEYADRALALRPRSAGFWQMRGDVLLALGEADPRRQAEAAQAYREALDCGGDATTLNFKLAAMGEAAAPAAVPGAFVASLFDHYAARFDQHLVEQLDYRGPEVFAQMLQALLLPANAATVHDLGCGTGLCGPMLRPLARRLVGVDLSSGMLDRARARGDYDELVCADIVTHLQGLHDTVDLAVAADVLNYLGDLDPLFAALRPALRRAGLCIFSIERLQGPGPYALQATRRYAHDPAYVEDLATRHGLALRQRHEVALRHNAGADVAAVVFVLQKPG